LFRNASTYVIAALACVTEGSHTVQGNGTNYSGGTLASITHVKEAKNRLSKTHEAVKPQDEIVVDGGSWEKQLISARPDKVEYISVRAISSPAPYVVDGLALGGKVRFDSTVYNEYHCSPSEFSGLIWCQRQKIEHTDSGEVTFSNSILHRPDGTAVYINRYIEPAFFGAEDAKSEIDRLSKRYGENPRTFKVTPQETMPGATMAIWGKIELVKLDVSDVSIVASGGSPHKGIMVSFLGDLQRSAKLGSPIYRLTGGPGYLWVATFSAGGKGVLRFLTIDASQIALPSVFQNVPPITTLPSPSNSGLTSPPSATVSPKGSIPVTHPATVYPTALPAPSPTLPEHPVNPPAKSASTNPADEPFIPDLPFSSPPPISNHN
jgi:hypothetical protein